MGEHPILSTQKCWSAWFGQVLVAATDLVIGSGEVGTPYGACTPSTSIPALLRLLPDDELDEPRPDGVRAAAVVGLRG